MLTKLALLGRASEIASVLGYTRTVDMVRHLPDNERLCQVGTTPTGPQQMIIPEQDTNTKSV